MLIAGGNQCLVNAEWSFHAHTIESGISEEPRCNAPGLERGYCSDCGEYIDRVLPALGHSYVDGVCTRCWTYGPLDSREAVLSLSGVQASFSDSDQPWMTSKAGDALVSSNVDVIGTGLTEITFCAESNFTLSFDW